MNVARSFCNLLTLIANCKPPNYVNCDDEVEDEDGFKSMLRLSSVGDKVWVWPMAAD